MWPTTLYLSLCLCSEIAHGAYVRGVSLAIPPRFLFFAHMDGYPIFTEYQD